MDKAITSNWYQRPVARMALSISAILLVLAISLYFLGSTIRNPTINSSKVEWEVLKQRPFAESVSVIAKVVPEQAIVIDAPTTGQVSAVMVANGDLVQRNASLIILSNVEDEIRRMRDESSLQEQLAQSEISFIEVKKSVASKKKLLEDAEFGLLEAQRELRDINRLVTANLMSESAKINAESLVSYKARQKNAANNDLQLEFEVLKSHSQRLEASRKVLSRQLEVLARQAKLSTIKAQESGSISGLSVKVGERVNQGDRIGILATSSRKALNASVDEFYLNKVRINASATLRTADGQNYQMRVAHVDPNVSDGVFKITLKFTNQIPEELIDGQSLRASVTAQEQNSVLSMSYKTYEILKNRREVYILPGTGKDAQRRKIRFGKIGSDFVEVANGASEGDAIVFQYPPDLTTKTFRLR